MMGIIVIVAIAVGLPSLVFLVRELLYSKKVNRRVDEFLKDNPLSSLRDAYLDYESMAFYTDVKYCLFKLNDEFFSKGHILKLENRDKLTLELNCKTKQSFEDNCCLEYVKRVNSYIKELLNKK